MRLVPVNCIKEGCFLAKNVYDIEGRALLNKGVKLTEKILKKVELNGIQSLYINDEYSDNEIEDIIKPEIRQKAIKTVKESFESFAAYIENDGIKGKGGILPLKNEFIENINKVVNEILNEILAKRNVLINLVDIKSMDNYTYEHSVNVIVLSLILGLELNMPKDRLFMLAVGAMLHDIGKVFIPKAILMKEDKLTDIEYNIIKSHPTKGYEYLKRDDGISPLSKIIILQHHERVDGTGYPDGLCRDKIHEFSRITSIVDVYDALTSDRPYRMAMPPNEAIEYIMGSADRYFDLNMVNAFLRRIVPYPVGTLVKLNGGRTAIVEGINPDYPLRPKIGIIIGKGPHRKIEHVDLMEVKNIVIKGIQYKAP